MEEEKFETLQTIAPPKRKRCCRNITHEWKQSEISKLISAVEQKKQLWQTNHHLYKNRQTRDAAWRDIEENVFGGTIKAHEIISKWGSLRVQYKHAAGKYNCIPSGSGCVKKWKHFDAMNFIKFADESFTDSSVSNLQLATMDTDSNASLSSSSNLQPILSSNSRPKSNRSSYRAKKQCPDFSADDVVHSCIQMANESLKSDELLIFGKFVAAEINRLPTDKHRQQLKRMIQTTIMDYSEMVESEMD